MLEAQQDMVRQVELVQLMRDFRGARSSLPGADLDCSKVALQCSLMLGIVAVASAEGVTYLQTSTGRVQVRQATTI